MFPPVDRQMLVRLRRLRMGLLSYLMFLLPLAYAVSQGWTQFDFPGLALFGIVAVLINLGFWLAIRSGWSLRFRDPALTLWQIAASQALAIVMIRYAGEARSVLLMLFVAAFFFGIFALRTRQMLWLAAAVLVAYGTFIVWPVVSARPGAMEARLELLRFLTLGMVLVWLSLLGGYVGQLRARLVEALGRVRALASHDELTGTYNRRHLMEILSREKERADRYRHPVAVCMLDLDHFKAINDRHGHEAGDEVLRVFAQRLRAHARVMDWVARNDQENAQGSFGRLGGEEFLLVLPHADLPGAVGCVERVRGAIVGKPIAIRSGELTIDFSAGVAVYRGGEEMSEVLRRADDAMYRAKQLGRGRTEMEQPGTVPRQG